LWVVVTVVLFPKDSSDIKFERISQEDGLSQLSVNYIIRDIKGFMWFATQDGLNRYDGYGFTVYNHDRDVPTSISTNHIRVILEDPEEDVIWIATSGGGLNKFDPVIGTFTRYLHDPKDPTSLSHDSVFSLYRDRRGELWVGTLGGGLNKFDKDKGTFIHYKHDALDNESLSDDQVLCVYEDNTDLLWFGTNFGGVNKYDRLRKKFKHYKYSPIKQNSLSGPQVRAIYEDHEGLLWIGTWGGGLCRYNRANLEGKLVMASPSAVKLLGYDDINEMLGKVPLFPGNYMQS
ncbi:two-component regulator propeller domain-containing protein, partial [Acidobacteriota bacterium]